ncbi:hypothetical protein TNCV_4833141 [Trichonephila clavipes]|nr:hypothetical protein TNCV_4833141 [Trichonephila clavipes]
MTLSPVCCSKLRLTTGVTWPFAMMKFVAIDRTFVYQLRVLVAALWDKKLAFRTRERRKILDFYRRTATQGEKEIFGRAVLRFNSASEKESVLLIEDQTDL